MLDKLKHIDFWRHLWRPFRIFSNAWKVRRTPGAVFTERTYAKKILKNFVSGNFFLSRYSLKSFFSGFA